MLIWSLVCRKPTENGLAPRNTGVIPQNGGQDFLGQRYTPNPPDNFGAYLVFRHITTRHPSCLLLPLLPPLLPPLGSPRRPTNQCGDPTVRRPPAGTGSIPHLPKQNARSGQYVFGNNWFIFGSSVFFASEWGSHRCGYGGVVFSCEHCIYWSGRVKDARGPMQALPSKIHAATSAGTTPGYKVKKDVQQPLQTKSAHVSMLALTCEDASSRRSWNVSR